jgi:hypothetical protein
MEEQDIIELTIERKTHQSTGAKRGIVCFELSFLGEDGLLELPPTNPYEDLLILRTISQTVIVFREVVADQSNDVDVLDLEKPKHIGVQEVDMSGDVGEL